jgi:hypothetical protein
MPELVRLYIRSTVIGFAVSALFTLGLVLLDVAGIGRLILGSDIGWIAAGMMLLFNGIVFAAVQFGISIMAMADTDEGPRGGLGAHEPVLVPVRVQASTKVRMRR